MQKTLAIAAFFLCASASAQVYKCPAPGGKIVYSDVPCTGGVDTGIQNVPSEARPYDPANDPNARAAAILQADREAKDAASARENIRRSAARNCSFESFLIGDQKGKELADDARRECLVNAELKASGQPTSSDAYRRWKDHFEITNNRRQAAQESLRRKSLTCTKGLLPGTLDCD